MDNSKKVAVVGMVDSISQGENGDFFIIVKTIKPNRTKNIRNADQCWNSINVQVAKNNIIKPETGTAEEKIPAKNEVVALNGYYNADNVLVAEKLYNYGLSEYTVPDNEDQVIEQDNEFELE